MRDPRSTWHQRGQAAYAAAGRSAPVPRWQTGEAQGALGRGTGTGVPPGVCLTGGETTGAARTRTPASVT